MQTNASELNGGTLYRVGVSFNSEERLARRRFRTSEKLRMTLALSPLEPPARLESVATVT